MVKFTIIIPVYNRPSELEELLDSLTHQDYKAFEIIVIDDGSDVEVESQVKDYSRELNIRFIRKENTGQGFSRNIAAQQAHGEYLVFFDSDCLIPESYFKEVESFIGQEKIDAWGGPDRAHDSFTVLQKAISFTMTSVLTTGGIRGKKSHVGKFQPRSFNMGISKEVFLDMGGFHQTNLGEDVELSMRLLEKGCKTVLIERAFVYHKRRTSLAQFYKQAFSFGQGRVLSGRKKKGGIKLVHLFPLLFTLSLMMWPLTWWIHPFLFFFESGGIFLYMMSIGIFAVVESRSLVVGLLSMVTAIIQLSGYGWGFLIEYVKPVKKK